MKLFTLGFLLSLASLSAYSQQLIDVSGRGGQNSDSGSSGSSGSNFGDDGGDGSNGSQPFGRSTKGANGRNIRIKVAVSGSVVLLSGDVNARVPLDDTVIINTRGGAGGNGGDGGDGGDGGNGDNGDDANSFSSPSDGGDGGDGGNGADGTPGSDGGDGGNITIEVSPEDAYVLSHFEFQREGGAGGRGGQGGRGGSGGSGGSSGSTSYVDSEGHFQSKCCSSSGSSGSSGRSGNDASSGKAGRAGRLSILSGGQIYSSAPKIEIDKIEISEAENDGRYAPNEVITLKTVRLINTGGMPIKLSGNSAPKMTAGFVDTEPKQIAKSLSLRANESTVITLPKNFTFKLPNANVNKKAANLNFEAFIGAGDMLLSTLSENIQVKGTEYMGLSSTKVELDEKKKTGKISFTVTNETNRDRKDLHVRVKRKGGDLKILFNNNGKKQQFKDGEIVCDDTVALNSLESNVISLAFEVDKAASLLSNDAFEVELVKTLPGGKEVVVGTDKFSIKYGLSDQFKINIDQDVNKLNLECTYADGDKFTINKLWMKKNPGGKFFTFQYERDGVLWNFNSEEMFVKNTDTALKPFITQLAAGKAPTKKELAAMFKTIMIPRSQGLNKDWKIKECH